MKSLIDLQNTVGNAIENVRSRGIDPATVPVVLKTGETLVYREAGFGCTTHSAVPAAGTSVHVQVFNGGTEVIAVIE